MRKNSRNTIEIQEEVRIPGTDVILEKGDKIQVNELQAKVDESELLNIVNSHLDDVYDFGKVRFTLPDIGLDVYGLEVYIEKQRLNTFNVYIDNREVGTFSIAHEISKIIMDYTRR